MTWYEHTIKPRLPNLTLEDLQDLFFIQTMSPYWLSARLVKLCQISYRESELLRSFNSRVSSAAVNGKFDALPGCVLFTSLYFRFVFEPRFLLTK
jgi:hypothetical protein